MTNERQNRPEGRVLVVDDERDVREVLGILLEAHGFEVVLAAGGEEALRIVRSDPIDVIVLDVMMPGMDGFDVCRELRGSLATPSLPVILLTARDDMQARAQGMKLGVSEFLAKPVNQDEFLKRLRTQVAARRREVDLARLERRAQAAAGSPPRT
jgi:two-component system cell cycle response regulator